jgi:5-methylcytosine-specific restriction protein A
MSNRRSEEALAYRAWYKSPSWEIMRDLRLTANPFCAYCERQGRLVRATVCDHVRPHRGDPDLFFDLENTQSLCKRCHDSTKAREENYAIKAVGPDGYPIDPRHPNFLDRSPS